MRRIACLATSIIITAAPAYADVLPGPVLPEQVSKSLTPKPSDTPATSSKQTIALPERKTQLPDVATQQTTFKFNGLQLSGNHVYTDEELEHLYKDKLHQTITVKDIYAIIDNITNYYRNNGYILSFAYIPPHRTKDGIVQVKIVEGYINHVSVIGNPGRAKCLFKRYGNSVKQLRPFNISTLNYALLNANNIPGASVKAILKPAESNQGGTDLLLNSQLTPVSGYLSYDNFGTRYIGPQQMTANIRFNSLIQSGDSTSFTLSKTPKQSQLTFTDINYSAAVGKFGDKVYLGYIRSKTHPLFVLTSTDTDGLSDNYYITYQHVIVRSQLQTLNLTAGFNYQDSESTALGSQLYQDHIRSLDLGANYYFADKYAGSNQLNINLRKGLPMFGYSSDTSQFTAITSRPGGYAAYTKFMLQASRLQAIEGNLSMLAAVKAQWAFVPLLSAEQFTFGGSTIGRGFDPAELIGDRGAAGSVELRYDFAINNKIFRTIQTYAFYDIGAIWNARVNSSSPAKVSATSTGAGIRFTMSKYISGNLYWAQPLTKQVAAEKLIGQGSRPRTFFSVVASF